MVDIKGLGPNGIKAFKLWIESNGNPVSTKAVFPKNEIFADAMAVAGLGGLKIDETRLFQSRYEWGCYLVETLKTANNAFLCSPQADPVWSWLCAIFISQLTNNFTDIKKPENYIILRDGDLKRRVHRNAARTTFIFVKEHGVYSKIFLFKQMHIRGELTENLSASNSYLTHKTFFELVNALYIGSDGKPKSGAMSKPKSKKDWTRGNRSGLGGVRRLITFLDRLYYTYDTLDMNKNDMLLKLPKEFVKFNP